MKISDLHPRLQKAYSEKSEEGLVNKCDPDHPHIHFVVPPAPPREKTAIHFSTPLLSEAQGLLHKLPQFDEMDELDKLINYLFVRREALQSSRLEGTSSTIEAVFSPAHADPESNRDGTKSVVAYTHALESIFASACEKKEKIFSVKLLCKIHKEMMEKDPNYMGVPGLLRSPGQVGSIVYIGGRYRVEDSIYNPAPPALVASSLKKVMDWYSDKNFAIAGDAGVGMNLIMRMAIGHSHFEAVHPFTDGNGRVGRALWPLQMVASGCMPLYLSGYVEREKISYYQALEKAQKKLNYTAIIDFISQAIISCSLEMKVTKENILSLPDIWRKRGQFKKGSTADKALTLILKHPIFTMNDLKEKTGCSAPAAARAVSDLVNKKIVRERTGYKRNRVFAAEEVIWLLAREHGSDAELALDRARRLF